MKLATTFALLGGSFLIGISTASLADDHDSAGIQTAIDQHKINIGRFETAHPDKKVPKGLVHSLDILEKIQAGERPVQAKFDRPERPEMPDVAMRPELPEMAMRAVRPEPPNRPDKPNNGRH